MKKLILIVIMAVCSLVAAAQEQSEKKLILKNGTTLTGIVEVQTDGSYQLKTAAGDILYFAPSEVERVTDATAKEKNGRNTSSVSDGINTPDIVMFRKGNLRFIETGELLTREDFYDLASWDKYNKARRTRKWGLALQYIGYGLIAGAGIGMLVGMDEDIWFSLDLGGGLTVLTGATLTIVGNLSIKAIEKAYNQHPGYALDFGVQQHGVGFALKF